MGGHYWLGDEGLQGVGAGHAGTEQSGGEGRLSSPGLRALQPGLLAEAFKASADLEVVGTALHVRLDPLSAPRRSRAVAALCAELTATETVYPGTELRLVFSVKGY